MQFEDYDDVVPSWPVLYYDVLSSHARSCQMLVHLLKADVDLQPTDSMAAVNFNETYTWLNSFCRLPTLVDGSVTLCNGHSILIYLCQKYAPKSMSSLCPCDYITRQKLTSLLYYEGSTLNRYISNLLTDIFLVKYPNFAVDYHKRKASIAYNSLNAFLNGHSFMIGSRLTIADISIVSIVSALNIIFPINHEKFPQLFDWFQRLRQMDFYKYNDEGIQKLRHTLKNVGEFDFPSTLNDDQERMELNFATLQVDANKSTAQAKRQSSHNEDGKPAASTRKDAKHISQTKQSTSMKEGQDFMEHKNDGVEKDTEKFKFYDTYFINVSQCTCCAVPERKEAQKGLKGLLNDEICGQLTSGEHNCRKLENHELDSARKIATCFCKKHSINAKRSEVLEANSKNAERFRRENTRIAKSNAMEVEGYEQSSASNSDDTNAATSGEDQKVNNKLNNKRPTSRKEVKKQERYRLRDEEEASSRSSSKIMERTSADSANATENVSYTTQNFQELLEKVRKYEKILEHTDKVLQSNTFIAATKTPSDTSSIYSVKKEQWKEKNLPHKCDGPNCSGQQKFQKNCKRRSSRIEALEFDDAIPIVLPKVLVANSENEAGTNPSPLADVPGAMQKFKLINGDCDDNMSQSRKKLSCTKYGGESNNTCSCADCSGQRNLPGTKTDGLEHVDHVPGELYKISDLLAKEIDCDFQNYQNM